MPNQRPARKSAPKTAKKAAAPDAASKAGPKTPRKKAVRGKKPAVATTPVEAPATTPHLDGRRQPLETV